MSAVAILSSRKTVDRRDWKNPGNITFPQFESVPTHKGQVNMTRFNLHNLHRVQVVLDQGPYCFLLKIALVFLCQDSNDDIIHLHQ